MADKKIFEKVDHTLLLQGSIWEEIREICDDAIRYGTASVCIPPSFVKRAKEYVGDRMAVCTVIGFPNGYNTTEVKAFETKNALENGADEIDMVINIGDLKDKRYEVIEKDIGPGVKMKAAGGISSFADAERFIELGAARLGTSRIVKLAKQEEKGGEKTPIEGY